MNTNVTVTVQSDTATPELEAAMRAIVRSRVERAVGTACTLLTKNHLNAMPPNKQGWPSTRFYQGAARGTEWSRGNDGVVINIDNPNFPGAMRQRYFGGTINMKDKLLSIPARQEFYGHSPRDFTNLRFGMFKSGTKFLYIGTGGVGDISHAITTGRERSVKGAGARTAMMVAFWLVESVDQEGDKDVIPSPEEYIETSKGVVLELWRQRGNN